MKDQNPWLTREQDYPADQPIREQLRFCLNYAVLAPSGHNTQPWAFELYDDGLRMRIDRDRRLAVVDPQDRELIISCGAALDHLETTLRYFGHRFQVLTLPDSSDPDCLASITIEGDNTSDRDIAQRIDQEAMIRFKAIPDRRTTRHAYEKLKLEDRLAEQLHSMAEQAGVELTVIEDHDRIHAIAELVAQGDLRQFSDPEFRRELSEWIHARSSSHHDGVPGDGIGLPDALTPIGAMMVRRFDLGKGVAARDEEIAEGTPTFLLLSTPKDEKPDWLACGGYLSRLLLTATASGITNAYLNQPVEVPELRTQLADVVGSTCCPQLLLRAGVGPSVEPSPRRPVEDVLYLREGMLPR